jgi:hypothetical protein
MSTAVAVRLTRVLKVGSASAGQRRMGLCPASGKALLVRRHALLLVTPLTAAGVIWAAPVRADISDTVRIALQDRFRLSRVAVDSELVAGRVFKPSTILILQAAGVPAKKFRAIQHLPKWPRFHVRDYAPVIIDVDGRLKADPGDFTLVRARLMVLDLQVKADRVHLLTHTLEPL